MGRPAATGTALLQCPFGLAPASLTVIPSTVMVEGKPAARISDMAPLVNIPTFGMCTSLANPQVASATAAALGVLTPMPCIPQTVGPWTGGATTTTIQSMPGLTAGATCQCAWGGVIQITFPGAVRTTLG